MRGLGLAVADGATLLRANRLLRRLPDAVLTSLQARLEHVQLVPGQALCDAGDSTRHVYFPITGMVSLVGTNGDGGSVVVATIGSDGAVGLSVILQDDCTVHSARVQIAGSALRISARALQAACDEHPPLSRALLRWTHRVMADMSHAVVCHRFHQVLERLCSYLLRTSDRTGADHLALTHESLAEALGASRKAVSLAALAVLNTGAIRYRHGRITIVDRARLLRSACDCYIPPDPS